MASLRIPCSDCGQGISFFPLAAPLLLVSNPSPQPHRSSRTPSRPRMQVRTRRAPHRYTDSFADEEVRHGYVTRIRLDQEVGGY